MAAAAPSAVPSAVHEVADGGGGRSQCPSARARSREMLRRARPSSARAVLSGGWVPVGLLPAAARGRRRGEAPYRAALEGVRVPGTAPFGRGEVRLRLRELVRARARAPASSDEIASEIVRARAEIVLEIVLGRRVTNLVTDLEALHVARAFGAHLGAAVAATFRARARARWRGGRPRGSAERRDERGWGGRKPMRAIVFIGAAETAAADAAAEGMAIDRRLR